MPVGKVYIVGAGPGDAKLLTVRALEVIRGADVIIYDRLVSAAVLRKIPRGARKEYAGKEPGDDGSAQDKINELMVKEARTGSTVVRLKGGDPFIFSRGGEEAEFLKKHGVKYEIVPGVTSAIGVPTYAGIPLTHRDFSSSLTILTGHEVRSKAKRLEWSRVARASDTLVVLMGAANLQEISKALLAGGLPSSTPVAAIRWGTTEKQQTTLLTLAEAASSYHRRVSAPSVIVIGRVVLLASKLGWYREALRTSPGYEALLNRPPRPRAIRRE